MWHQYSLPDLAITLVLHVVMVTLSVLCTMAVLSCLKRVGLIVEEDPREEQWSRPGTPMRYMMPGEEPLLREKLESKV